MRQALELALEFIEQVNKDGWILTDFEPQMYETITAIKEALAQPERDYERGFIDGMQKQMQSSVDKAVNRMAQPEQEPVAMLERDPSIGRLRVTYEDAVTELDEGVYPLYTKPQGWRDNVAQAYLKGFDEGCKSMLEKNQNEPVAWMYVCDGADGLPVLVHTQKNWARASWWHEIPLYTTPPQRTWAGLTEEERGICINANIGTGLWAMAKDIEDKLKEKNNG